MRTNVWPIGCSAAVVAAALLAAVTAPIRAQASDSTKTTPAQADTNPIRTFGGFVDTYYAWDFDRPSHFDRNDAFFVSSLALTF